MSDCLPALEVNPEHPARASIIWLHGLGADGNDFAPIVPELHLPASMAVRFVFPHAPSKPITINQGYVMRAWFDILEPGKERAIDAAQLLMSSAEIHKLIDREIERGVSSEHILLAGFSQGGAVCYQAGLTYDKPLGGILALSTWFPTAGSIELHPANSAVPIAVFHGTDDPILPMKMAENSLHYLEQLGLKPSFASFPMGHTVCSPEVELIAEFIRSHLPGNP